MYSGWDVAALFSLKVGACGKARHPGDEVAGKTLDGGVVASGGFVEVIAGGSDAVFGAFQLGLEIDEILVGLEIGIVFRDDKEARERITEGTLSRLIFLKLGGIGRGLAGIDFDLPDAGPGLNDIGQG